MDTKYIVIAREDSTAEGQPGAYSLCTRTVFDTDAAAKLYAATVSSARQPLVIPGHWANLRLGEERSTEAYWRNL